MVCHRTRKYRRPSCRPAGALVLATLAVLIALAPSPCRAAGSVVHIFMVDEAVRCTEAPDQQAFLIRNQNALRNGAIFPDSGYIWKDTYGETVHWTDFDNAFVRFLAESCAFPLSTECEELLSFFLGSLAHGVSDCTFHREFVSQVADHDFDGDYGAAHSFADQGVDLVAMVDWKRETAIPSRSAPTLELQKILFDCNVTVSRTELDIRTKLMHQTLRDERALARTLYGPAKRKGPWATANYYNATGGVLHSARDIASMWAKIWERLGSSGFEQLDRFRVVGSSFPNVEIVLE
ncbi:uncharacterized protein BJ171DRAFT_495567 [Polychytrium aggregatum]|uniref:uncharacterized protein n=1 Tax=Polychytrium aggregatum TaxID=110093 RepID=UPI0022FF035B|nr:uncharacterized protein BJ171DRAFT_495567 [Polychytrium aggregatum]KAI9207067.1 hypothetical protein BJ171DRAFT_495567 [Polychytrium aggregatum]